VIDEIEKQLSLGRTAVEPSRASLFRFGNVSSSSIWWVPAAGARPAGGLTGPPCDSSPAHGNAHACGPISRLRSLPPASCLPLLPTERYVLAYIETFRGVKRGDRVWQLGFGSGFKCNSAVWKANRAVRDRHAAWEGFDVDHMVRPGPGAGGRERVWAGG
jgi:3-ketoacyl-CoA synthase